MFSIKSVYITVPHESHNTILCVLTSMVHVALSQITAQYQIQISDKNNNNNNNDKVYTPLSEKCSQSRVFISQCHIIHIVQYYAYWLVWFM